MINSPVNFTVKSDEGDEWIIKLDINNHTVKDLKRMILNKKNKPFILFPPVTSCKSLKHLLDKNNLNQNADKNKFAT